MARVRITLEFDSEWESPEYWLAALEKGGLDVQDLAALGEGMGYKAKAEWVAKGEED